MKAKPTEPGRVVISTQGHDAGRWYVVLSVLDDRFVTLSTCLDGSQNTGRLLLVAVLEEDMKTK